MVAYLLGYVVRAFSSSGLACADCPDRLISDGTHERALNRKTMEHSAHLFVDHLHGMARFLLLQIFAHTDDRFDIVPNGGFDLFANFLVCFVEIMPAFRMPQ